MNRIFLGLTIVIVVLSVAAPTRAEDHGTYSVELEGFDYPHDVNRYRFGSQGSDVPMAYMDVKPQTTNGRTAVLEFLCRDLGKDDQGRGLLHRNAPGDVGRQGAVLVGLRLMLEISPGRHRDHGRANARRKQLLVGVDTETDLAENTIGMVAVAAYPAKVATVSFRQAPRGRDICGWYGLG